VAPLAANVAQQHDAEDGKDEEQKKKTLDIHGVDLRLN